MRVVVTSPATDADEFNALVQDRLAVAQAERASRNRPRLTWLGCPTTRRAGSAGRGLLQRTRTYDTSTSSGPLDTTDPSPSNPEDRGGPSYDPSIAGYAGISDGALDGGGDVRDARAFAEMIVDTVREGLLVLDFDLSVVSANESFYQMFKVDPEQTLGRKVYDLGDGQWDLPELRDLLEDILPREGAFNDYQVEHDFEGLGRRVILLNARRLDDHHLILLAIQDATARRRAEEDLERARHDAERARDDADRYAESLERSLEDLRAAQDRLVRQEKMASLGRLAAGVAHEIKNPLNFVNNFAELTLELLSELRRALAAGNETMAAELLADVEANTRMVRQHGQRANEVVEQMMDHARSNPLESTPRRSVDVNALVGAEVAVAMDRRRADRLGWACRIVEDYGATTGAVSASPEDIARIVQSLLQNALDAVDERAASGATPYEPIVRVQTYREGENVSVAVSDNGPGLADHLRQRVFEPFYTTRPTGSGHPGLGLSLAHETLVAGYGGQIEIESEEGAGSTFTVRLPAA